MMEAKLNTILEEAQKSVINLSSRAEFEAFKARLMGPRGSFTECGKGIGKLPKEERPIVGKHINVIKKQLELLLNQALERIEDTELTQSLGADIDPTLPSPDIGSGTHHIISQVRREICSIFRKVGFTVAEGPELDTEFYCFDALNTPPEHPARDAQDTYYLPQSFTSGNLTKREDERYVLRPHTSTVQVRTLLTEKPPLRIISPGRCFRRDTMDATHSANFVQLEGLYVDKNVTVKDLKAILEYFIRALLGEKARMRFRPHFFPYTEPSFEVDFYSGHLEKVGAEWVEVMGCGMVDPSLFEAVDYDPNEWTGYAFGMGIERIAMILYGVDDVRYFYQNDLRFLKQFS